MEKELIRITKEFGHDNIPIAFIAKPGPGVISGYIYYYKDNEIKESIFTDLNINRKTYVSTYVSNSIKPYVTTLINDYEQIKFKAIVYAQDDIRVLYKILLKDSTFEHFFLKSGLRIDYTDNNFDLIDKILRVEDIFFKHFTNYIKRKYNLNITPIVLILDSFNDSYEIYYYNNNILKLQCINLYKSEKPFFNILKKYNMENHRIIETNILKKYRTLFGINNSEEFRALVYATDYKSILYKYGPYFYLSENYKIDYTSDNFDVIDNL